MPKYLIHHHFARREHWDLRLEVDGVLKSWAVPKEPSPDPKVKRLAVLVEDHPLEYGDFEGTIPEGQYGAGEVRLWDSGSYENLASLPMAAALAQGRVEVLLTGHRLQGGFALIRFKGKEKDWLFFKMKD
ncbi:MAG: 3'-phosphoesterase [Deltaproteobacteria bacterium]|nr:3'-phosphoesterase [Deltaproteobacteria bacterium]